MSPLLDDIIESGKRHSEENDTEDSVDCSRPTMAAAVHELQHSRRDVRSRMMKHMIDGQATSLSECLLVIVAGQVLAFNSGFTNGACLSGFLLKDSERRQGVAAFTGAYTGSALSLARGDNDKFGFQVCMILSFMFGAWLAGLLTPRPEKYRIEPTYGPTFLIGGVFLLAASLLSVIDHIDVGDDFVFYLAAIANGTQNGLSSLYSGNLIRSTHFTGITTDIAIITAQLMRGNRENNWKLVVLVALATSFWTGGFVSFYATQRFTSYTLLFNAALFLAVGFVLVLYLMHEYSISFFEAMMGTWHWKRALDALTDHHRFEELSTKNIEARERLNSLFSRLDTDASGSISPDELLFGLRQAGFAATTKEIAIMIQFADRDGNGVISEDEWLLLLEELDKRRI